MNLFQLGQFTLSGGATSPWKIDCDALTDDDWATLARMVWQMVGPFSAVTGVPRGGMKLAAALQPFVALHGPRLIVDDVLTTGKSMEDCRVNETDRLYRSVGLGPKDSVIGAVVFARGQCPPLVRALFQMPECFWVKPRTRG